MKKIAQYLNNLFSFDHFKKNPYKIQTFTYFIPAPPERPSGYREKNFDKIFSNFINQGFEVISIHTTPCNSQNQSGMWITCLLRAMTDHANALTAQASIEKELKLQDNNVEKIEGLYYIENENGPYEE